MAELRSEWGCGTALNSWTTFRTTVAADSFACFFGVFLHQGASPALDSLLQQSWSKPSRPACLTGTLHPFLMSPVGTPSGEGCLRICPRGRGEMGHRDALKLWLAPRVKKGLIHSAPWGLAQYTAPKWMSSSPLFPLLAVHTRATALISTLLAALLFKPSAPVHSAGTQGISIFTQVIPASPWADDLSSCTDILTLHLHQIIWTGSAIPG